MGQAAIQRIQEVSGDFSEFGMDGPVFVVDHPAEHLTRSHMEELSSYSVAHGSAFTAIPRSSEDGATIGPSIDIQWIESMLSIKSESIEINRDQILSFNYNSKEDIKLFIECNNNNTRPKSPRKTIATQTIGPYTLEADNTTVNIKLSVEDVESIALNKLKAITFHFENMDSTIKENFTIKFPDKSITHRSYEINGRLFDLNMVYGGEKSDASSSSRSVSCVICLGDDCNTTVLPCRHMCLCQDCAKNLVSGGSKCPICRRGIQCFLRLHGDTVDIT